MSTILGVALVTSPTPSVAQKLAALGVVVESHAKAPPGLFIAADGSDLSLPESLANRISEATGATCFSVAAQSSADVYTIGEHERGALVRKLTFNRDDGGWSPPNGFERPWEADFHLALPMEEFLDRLSDNDEWSEQDLEAARSAHQNRQIGQLPRLPHPSAANISAFLKHRGVDIESPIAKYRKPSLLKKLFQR